MEVRGLLANESDMASAREQVGADEWRYDGILRWSDECAATMRDKEVSPYGVIMVTTSSSWGSIHYGTKI